MSPPVQTLSTPAASRITIITLSGQDPLALAQHAWAALQAGNVPEHMFRRGSMVVRLVHDASGRPRLQELTLDRFQYELAQVASFRVATGGGRKPNFRSVMPPRELVRYLLSDPQPPFPTLDCVVETPVLVAGGRIVDKAGFDATSGVYLDPPAGPVVPQLPATVTLADVARAVALVEEPFTDFPFVTPSDRAHAIALMVQPFVRLMVDGSVPCYLVSSPGPGTGKGLAVQAALAPAFGPDIASTPAPDNPDECRKKVFAILLAGQMWVFLDNLTGPLASGALASFLTARSTSDRVLRESRVETVPIRATFAVTANAPTVSLELARRIIPINLDGNCQRPWTRGGFKHPDLLQWVASVRNDLIWAVLVLAKSWLAAGSPAPSAKPLGSFELWTRVLGGILEHAGIRGFLGHAPGTAVVIDSQDEGWETLVLQWATQYKTASLGVQELLPLAEAIPEFPWPPSAHSDKSRRTHLGMNMCKLRNRVVGGFKVVAAGKKAGASLWKLQPVTPSLPTLQVHPGVTSGGTACKATPENLVNLGEPSEGPTHARDNKTPSHEAECGEGSGGSADVAQPLENGGPEAPRTSGEPGGRI